MKRLIEKSNVHGMSVIRRVNMRLNPKKIPSKGFIVLTDSAGHGEFQKKSLHKSDPGKGVNLHIFKMAANKTYNVGLLLTVYG